MRSIAGPACITCREKCRRCDRARPICQRCQSKGLQCNGYPDKFCFVDSSSRGIRKSRGAPSGRQSGPRLRTRAQIDAEHPPGGSPVNSTVEDEPRSFDIISQGIPGSESSPTLERRVEYHTEDLRAELDDLLMLERTESLLVHYDHMICPHQIALADDNVNNPYRLYVLPLSYEHLGLLYAVLGLSACHAGIMTSDVYLRETLAVEYRLRAIRILGSIVKEASAGALHEDDRDSMFALIQILLLHDIFESGVSTHGVHITGALSICNHLRLYDTLTSKDERTIFFLGNLAWLDVIRALPDPQRLCFSSELRETIAKLSDIKFEQVNGCPRKLFLIIGDVLEHAKAHAAGDMDTQEYERLLEAAQQSFYSWRFTNDTYPNDDPHWRVVAEAFRHACILHTFRLLDVTQPADTPAIQQSVNAILDAVAGIPPDYYLLELLVMPLFMAGTDALSPHSRHYVILRLDHITARAGFANQLPYKLLHKVWDARANQLKKDYSNIPWMLFTHATTLERQHDYLIL